MNPNERKRKHIKLTDLCKLLEVKGVKTALEWCQKHKVPTETISNKLVADLFFVQIELDRKIVKHLKSHYPDQWEDLYQCYIHNDKNGFIERTESEDVSRKTNSTEIRKTLNSIQPKSEFGKKFAAT